MQQPLFETNINVKKQISTTLFILCWLGFAFSIFSKKGFDNWIEYVFFIFSIYLFVYLLWLFGGSVKIILTNEKLIIEKQMVNFRYWKNTYDLNKVENLLKRTNDQADTYTRFGVFKIYDVNPSVIYFSYNGSSQKIGEGLEEFNTELIIKEIKTRKLILLKK